MAGALRPVIALIGAALSMPASAASTEPVPATNLTPFTAVLGHPSIRPAALAETGSWRWQVELAIASHSAIGRSAGQWVYLDGETTRLAVGLRYQPGRSWQLEITLPLLMHAGGFLDPLIDGWHSTTGLADGQRDRQGTNRIRYLLSDPVASYRLDRNRNGIGDVLIQSLHRLPSKAGRPMTLRLSVEAPTGSLEKLTGNGAADVALDLLLGAATSLRDRPVDWHFQLGVLRPGRGDLLVPLQRRTIAFGGIAAAWAMHPRATLTAQIALASDPWRARVNELGSGAAELTLGVRFGAWYLGFSEDLRLDRSPDFAFRVGWSAQPSSR